MTSTDKNALSARFVSNPRIAKSKDGCPLKLTLTSDSQLFLFANFECINEVKDMAIAALAVSQDSQALLRYYKGMVSEQLFKYVNEGSDYMLTVQENESQTKKVHNAIRLDLQLNAPVVFIPERYDTVQGNQVLVVDLGTVRIDSQLIEFDSSKNYKLVNNPLLLYDAYNFYQRGMQIMGFT